MSLATTYSQETIDRIIAETPGGADVGATAICTFLKPAILARLRSYKAEKEAQKQGERDANEALKGKNKGVIIDGVEVFGVPLGDGRKVSGLVRRT